jgi:nucleoside-diphosphate-sugar epimerase
VTATPSTPPCAVLINPAYASLTSDQRSVQAPRTFDSVNVRGTLNVLEAAREVCARNLRPDLPMHDD